MNRTLNTEKPIAPARLAHVVIRARNYDAMVKWWTELAGARIATTTPIFSFLSFDEEHHRIALVNMAQVSLGPPPAADPSASPIDHISFTYPDLGALLSVYERRKAMGLKPHKCINHGTTTSLYYCDPDGNQVEVQVENFPTMAEADAFLTSDAFRANPIGVEFDPEVLVERYCAGVPVTDLLKPGSTQVPMPA